MKNVRIKETAQEVQIFYQYLSIIIIWETGTGYVDKI